MSIATEIQRLQTAKADLKSAIEAKGVAVPSSATIDTYDDYVAQISGGLTRYTTGASYCDSTNLVVDVATEISIDGGTSWVTSGVTTVIVESGSSQCSVPTKWVATYIGGTVSSAQCDGSSAITANEIAISNLVTLEIGDCVTSIGDDVAKNASSLTDLVISDSVTTLGQYAFERTGLTGITIGSGVTTIPKGCFSRIAAHDIVFPDNVTTFGQYAADSCSNLTGITFGNNVQNIDREAFYAVNFMSITITTPTPPSIQDGTFGNSFMFNGTIYVPSDYVAVYKSAWSFYADHIQAIP